MKNIIIILTCALFLANCSNRYVLGTKCTSPDKSTGAYEKSFIWIVNSQNLNNFDSKINKENCIKNGENL